MLVSLDKVPAPLGYSGLSKAARCLRQYRLGQAAIESAQAQGLGPPPVTKANLAIGLGLHKLLELDALGRLAEVEGFTSGGARIDLAHEKEAWRLFHAYRLDPGRPYPLGVTVGVEVELKPAQSVALFGGAVTGTIDRVFTATPDVVAWGATKGLVFVPGGTYLQDYKSEGRESEDMRLRHRHALQFALYAVLWNLAHPDQPAMGTLVDCIVKTKEPKIIPLLLPAPSDAEIARVVCWANQICLDLAQNSSRANATACISQWGELCSHYGTTCGGY